MAVTINGLERIILNADTNRGRTKRCTGVAAGGFSVSRASTGRNPVNAVVRFLFARCTLKRFTMNRAIKFTLKYLLVIPLIFMGSLWCSMKLLQDINKQEVGNESDIYPYGVIVQSPKGVNVLWQREKLKEFLTENKDVKFLIQPNELAQVKNYFNEKTRDMGVRVGDILNAKQEITLTVESGPGLYSFCHEATENGIKPLYTNRYTIVDGILHFGIAGFVTMITLFVLKKIGQRRGIVT